LPAAENANCEQIRILGLFRRRHPRGEEVAAIPRAGFVRSGLKLGIAAVIVILLAPLAANLGHVFGALPNLFGSERHERVQPPVLKSLQDLAEYHAATANLQAVVEVSHDASYVPSFIQGDDTKFLAVGSVDATVNFSELGSTAVQTSSDGKSVTVTLPAPTYAPTHLDLDNSQILSRERGLLDRVGGMFTSDPTNDQSLYQLADQALNDAAPKTGVLDRAKANTTGMLTSMLRGLGYQNVNVTFVEPAAP